MKLILFLFFCAFINFSFAQTSITYGEAFNFDVGDEFHYTGSYLATNWYGSQYYVFTSRKFTIVSKTFSADGDTVFYHREGLKLNESTEEVLLNEINETFYSTNLDDYILGADSTYIDPERYLGKTIHLLYDSTISEDGELTSLNKAEYVLGLGAPKYINYENYGLVYDDISSSLVYFYKSETGEEWGTQLVLSTSNVMDESEIALYPNPSNGLLNWDSKSDLDSPIAIEILDLTGRTVMSIIGGISINQVDTSELPEGTYLLRMEFEKGTLTKRFVLQGN
ncbi:T9SS type A sorting domain-containing protein [Cryomorphaceae bacterium 1068]|nr:T9SS type A sorting domain-containing protein [Cryomorphaceae bacterium 1068]